MTTLAPGIAFLSGRYPTSKIYSKVNVMKTQLPIILFSTLLCFIPRAIAEDITIGTILALDREARLLILVDRSTWSLQEIEPARFAGLEAGERVEIRYDSDEDGIGEIRSIKPVAADIVATGAADITEGTVLVYDRKANIIVLSDRTVWPLELSKSATPTGLEAGNRIRIEYDSDEEGVSIIYGIAILEN